MATIGRNAAVTELPSGARFKGVLAWYMWLVLHLAYIVGLPQPGQRAGQLDLELPDLRPPRPHHRRRGTVAAAGQRPAQPPPAAPSEAVSRDRPVVG